MKKTTLAALFGILTLGQVCLAQEAGQEATTKQNVALEKKEHNTQADPNKGHEITTGDNGIYTTMTIPGLTSFTFDNGLSTSYFNFDIRAGYWYMINDYLVARGGIGIMRFFILSLLSPGIPAPCFDCISACSEFFNKKYKYLLFRIFILGFTIKQCAPAQNLHFIQLTYPADAPPCDIAIVFSCSLNLSVKPDGFIPPFNTGYVPTSDISLLLN